MEQWGMNIWILSIILKYPQLSVSIYRIENPLVNPLEKDELYTGLCLAHGW